MTPDAPCPRCGRDPRMGRYVESADDGSRNVGQYAEVWWPKCGLTATGPDVRSAVVAWGELCEVRR